MRTVILHYHIYKNAGTSFDHVLTHNYGDRHELFDGPYPFFIIDQEQLDRIIMRRPAAVAFSSHQIMLPQPSSLEYRALAAVFVRNPFLRIASIYRFKRGPERPDGTPLALLSPADLQAALAHQSEAPRAAYPDAAISAPDPLSLPEFDMTSTAIAARTHDLAGWIDHCLASAAEIGNVSNAQTRFFACQFRLRPAQKRTTAGITYDLGAALRTLSGVELLGRTEHFEQDVARFADILPRHGLTLRLPDDTRHNVTHAGGDSTDQRVEQVLSTLPPDLRDRLLRANRQDVALYDRACALIDRDHRV